MLVLTFRNLVRGADQLHHLRRHFDELFGLGVMLLLALLVRRLNLIDEVVGPEGADHCGHRR